MSDVFFISQFETYLVSEKKVSRHTSTAYLNDLRQCFNYLESELGITDVQSIKHLHLKSWLASLMADKMNASSVNRKISALKTYYKYLLRHQLVEGNPMLKVTSPKMSKKLPTFINESKTEEIFEKEGMNVVASDDDSEMTQANAIVSTLYQTGVRLSELINLKKRNVDIANGTIKVLGKRNKERIIPITEELSSILHPYLSLNPQSEWVFNTAKGEQLYPNYVYRAVKHLLSQYTTLKKKSPHILRHTFATHMLNSGSDLNAIKELLGHANLSATQIYTHNSIERLKEVYNKAHPKGKG